MLRIHRTGAGTGTGAATGTGAGSGLRPLRFRDPTTATSTWCVDVTGTPAPMTSERRRATSADSMCGLHLQQGIYL